MRVLLDICVVIDYIITRNEHDFSHSTVPIISPREFVNLIINNN